MKQLDTDTILEIIKMIDNQISHQEEGIDKGEYWAAVGALDVLKSHLQSFIEGQLNAAENNTGE